MYKKMIYFVVHPHIWSRKTGLSPLDFIFQTDFINTVPYIFDGENGYTRDSQNYLKCLVSSYLMWIQFIQV